MPTGSAGRGLALVAMGNILQQQAQNIQAHREKQAAQAQALRMAPAVGSIFAQFSSPEAKQLASLSRENPQAFLGIAQELGGPDNLLKFFSGQEKDARAARRAELTNEVVGRLAVRGINSPADARRAYAEVGAVAGYETAKQVVEQFMPEGVSLQSIVSGGQQATVRAPGRFDDPNAPLQPVDVAGVGPAIGSRDTPVAQANLSLRRQELERAREPQPLDPFKYRKQFQAELSAPRAVLTGANRALALLRDAATGDKGVRLKAMAALKSFVQSIDGSVVRAAEEKGAVDALGALESLKSLISGVTGDVSQEFIGAVTDATLALASTAIPAIDQTTDLYAKRFAGDEAEFVTALPEADALHTVRTMISDRDERRRASKGGGMSIDLGDGFTAVVSE